MGWRRDWLYRRIFDLVEDVWRKTQKEAARMPPPNIAPDFLSVLEYANANCETARCLPPILRAWKYSGGEFVPLSDADTQEHLGLCATERGMYFSSGAICFHIAPDRQRLIWTQYLGPRHGRGFVYRVVGQSRRATLEIEPGTGGWIS
jgi:hypothetical protein